MRRFDHLAEVYDTTDKMDTAELICLIIILIVLVAAVVLSCARCWGSMTTIAGEAAAKPTNAFTRDLGGQLRRSFRRATSFWGDRAETAPPQPAISSVSADVVHESDLHPVYFRHRPMDSPPSYDDVIEQPDKTQPASIPTRPRTTAERDTVNGIDNPAYAEDTVDSGAGATFNRTYIQVTNSGVVFPDSERMSFQAESYI